MKRSQAAELIDDVRELAAKGRNDITCIELRALLARHNLPPLKHCCGTAHSNAFIDNCMVCAPRWGFVGAKEPVR